LIIASKVIVKLTKIIPGGDEKEGPSSAVGIDLRMNNSASGPQNRGSILSIIDFSDASIESLKWALQLAKEKNTHLTVLYPYRLNLSLRGDNVSGLKKNMDTEAEESFTKITKPFLSEAVVPYDFHPEVGFIYDRVYAHSLKNNIQLIVMSQKMALANKDTLSDLVSVITVPLVIVPPSNQLK
jgi:hypothetical protein